MLEMRARIGCAAQVQKYAAKIYPRLDETWFQCHGRGEMLHGTARLAAHLH